MDLGETCVSLPISNKQGIFALQILFEIFVELDQGIKKSTGDRKGITYPIVVIQIVEGYKQFSGF